jgi:CheY-like chemotaxis protein
MPVPQILVVVPERIVALDIQHMLGSRGYTGISFAYSGEEARMKAVEARPDAIIMDITLRDSLDGLKTGSDLQKELNVPVIYLSSIPRQLVRDKPAGNSGTIREFVYKPFSEDDIRSALERALKNRGFPQSTDG